MIKLNTFKSAIASLERALTQPKNEFTRDAAIQRFEYTYELSWKLLKRYLQQEAGIEEFNIKNLFRLAQQQHLIENLDAWFDYHAARNLTSHTYNENTAEEAYQAASRFLIDVKLLYQRLEVACANSTKG